MLQRLAHIATLVIGGAMLWSASSAAAQLDVTINIDLGTPSLPPVGLAPPQFVAVPGSSVYYAPEATTNLFFDKGQYYTVANGVWSSSPVYRGPWAVVQLGKVPTPVLTVPLEYYKILPGHMKKKGPPPWAAHGHDRRSRRTSSPLPFMRRRSRVLKCMAMTVRFWGTSA
jgi:hypothetical protein